MRTVPLLLLAAILSAGGLGGCGTSHVFVDDPTARIWANGKLIGRGHGELKQRGMPETTSILVRTEDGRQQVTSVKRRITFTTVVGALFTYGTCLIFCWEYPDTVLASLPPGARGLPYGVPSSNGAGAAMFDPWLTPPHGWQPRATPPAAANRAVG